MMRDSISGTVITWIMVGVIICISAVVYFINRPSAKTVTGEAEYEIEAKKLFMEFDNDEEQANEKYLNRIITVNGEIKNISEPDSLGFTVTLDTEGMFNVTCEIPDREAAEELTVGERVNITGLCAGKLMDVVIVKSRIEKK